MKRLFISIDTVPDASFLAIYNKIKSGSTQSDRINWVKPDLMHTTLKFLGKTSEEKIPLILEGIRISVTNVSAFSLRIGRIGIFGSKYHPRVLWFGIDKVQIIEDLYQYLQEEMRKLDFKYDFGNYVPHITIARINKIEDKQRFWKVIKSAQTSFIQEVEVKSIILYESLLETYIPVYRKLGEIGLLL